MERLLNTYSGVAVVFFHNFRQSAMRIASGKQFFKYSFSYGYEFLSDKG